MDLIIILYWFLAFSVIVLFLGALNYFIGSPHSHPIIPRKQSQSDSTNQQQNQSNRIVNSNHRRKSARNANKKRQKAATVAKLDNSNSNNDNNDERKNDAIIFELKIDEEESLTESSVQPTNEEEEEVDEFQDPLDICDDAVSIPSCVLEPVQEEKESNSAMKQRNKCKSTHINSKLQNSSPSTISSVAFKQESVISSKPLANVAPVKQAVPVADTANTESTQIPQDINSKSIKNSMSPHDIYSHSGYNNLPPRFQEQDREKKTLPLQKFHRKKASVIQTKRSPSQLDSTTRQNDVEILTPKQQTNIKNPFELPLPSHEIKLIHSNGYSSESDILSESTSRALSNHYHSSFLSTSTESPYSLKELDIKRSLSTSNHLLDKLVSIFDTVSFSSDELELILKTISDKHLLNKQNLQNLLSAKTKNDKSMERLLGETYFSQAKILAVELQMERNRVLELTKTNVELDNTIKHLQQPNDSMVPYQQTILSYQMQMRRLTDENARLAHQLHAYSIMPGTINELRQQQHILDEQLRQLANSNSSLEKEIADGERARKHAADIYKKADDQKQERIEQMIVDLSKYKKIETDLNTLRRKYAELKENQNADLNDLIDQRDQLTKICEQLKEKAQKCKELKIKCDQLAQNETETSNLAQLQQELNEAKARNDLLQKRHMKILEQLNKHKQNYLNQSS